MSAFTRNFNSFKSQKLHFPNATDQFGEPESQILTSLSNHDHHPVPHINIVTKNTLGLAEKVKLGRGVQYRVKITIFIMIVFRIGRSDNSSSSSNRSKQRDQVWELGRRASLHTASRGGIPNTKHQMQNTQRRYTKYQIQNTQHPEEVFQIPNTKHPEEVYQIPNTKHTASRGYGLPIFMHLCVSVITTV